MLGETSADCLRCAADHPKVKALASTPESRSSIWNCRSRDGLGLSDQLVQPLFDHSAVACSAPMPVQDGTFGLTASVSRLGNRIIPCPSFVDFSNWTRHLHSLDPSGARWSRLKRVTEILGLTDNLFILKFHDTHRIRWLRIVSEDEFGHPEIGSANNSPH